MDFEGHGDCLFPSGSSFSFPETDPHAKLSSLHNATPVKDVGTPHGSKQGTKKEGSNPINGLPPPSKKNLNQKPDTSGGNEQNFAKRIGKTTAREFIERNTVFPNREDFIIDEYEHSFSSILDRKTPNNSYLKQEKYFNVFFFTNIPYWFKCCNEARGDLVSKTKDRYFSKLN